MSILPVPVKFEEYSGFFQLTHATTIMCGNYRIPVLLDYLQGELQQYLGWQLSASGSNPNSNSIVFHLSTINEIPDEGYLLNISESSIQIIASTEQSLFYGVQSLLQLVFAHSVNTDSVSIPCCIIDDYPRFRWRGMHLDVSRHFFGIEEIKRVIDWLARHKMNRFHFHLTDDQGWRVPSDRYPKLATHAAWRLDENGMRYGGCYTKNELCELVAYAASRFVTIVPEIDVPGHTVSAISAYPALSCTGQEIPVPANWGIYEDVLCAGNEFSYEFVEAILAEVAEIFPSEFIHIGGDECPKTHWLQCPRCQQRMRELGVSTGEELQSHFIKRVANYLMTLSKRAIGWDEILEGGLASGAAVMSWRGTSGGIAAASAGHDVVMSPTSHCYFDYYQGDPALEPPAFKRQLSLEQVYTFDPIPDGLDESCLHHVLGGQANVWTEYMPDWKQVEYMVFPRLCAMSEVLWSPLYRCQFDEFKNRLKSHRKHLDRWGYHYRAASFHE